MIGQSQRSNEVAPFVLTQDELEKFGLQVQDGPEIESIARRIDATNPDTVYHFGRDVAEHTASYADSLLEQIRNKDLDEAGSKLTEIVNLARNVNITNLTQSRSTLPIIGPLVDKIRTRGKNFAAQFASSREQIDALVSEVAITQNSLSTNNGALQSMFDEVVKEHHLIGLHIAAGKVRLTELQQTAAERRAEIGNNPAKFQDVADMDTLIANLDKRIGDLIVTQHSAMQVLPMLRIIQANNQSLIDKFHSVREITVPNFKRQFLLAISLNGQKNAVTLANDIDDANNELLRSNAKLLQRNAIATMKANQRLVIDVSTLKEVQDTLIQTVGDVIKIQQEGASKLRETEKQVLAMREDLRARLTAKGVSHGE
ncbi:toxic anion resistance protein [Enterobacter cloacae complex sp. ECC445]|uniref:toxic anion resistance protein n=1 Tax=Enterobacter cloacae complex sp. ECC445 TaxID=2913213 RepID=UPI001F2B3A6E|nr:toxic anion resistance protein [Enterobacter cloacae complex sp. ECC445]MCG0456542.1 toxic anion resistance protein [Enterobacter cloacae complex sp. ECC445]